MNLDAVKASGKGILGGLYILLDQIRQFFGFQRAWRDEPDELGFTLVVGDEGHAGRGDGGGRYRQRTLGLQRGMGNAAHMPELHEHQSVGVMDRLGHQAPAFDLLGAMDARRPGIALPLLGNLRGLADDQARPGALRVIEGVQSARDVAWLLASRSR